jgi:hypothetical protein
MGVCPQYNSTKRGQNGPKLSGVLKEPPMSSRGQNIFFLQNNFVSQKCQKGCKRELNS